MNEQLEQVRVQLVDAFSGLANSVVNAVPLVVVGILLLLVGIVVAKLLQRMIRLILTRLRVDDLFARTGIDQMLSKVGFTLPPSRLIPKLAYYLILFLLARTGADALGLAAVSGAIGSFLAYVPNLIAAVLVLLLGGLAGRFAGNAVAAAAAGSGIDYGGSLGAVVQALVLFVSGVMALGQLSFETDIVRIVTICVLAGLALAFGLSFGLGTREVVRNILAGFYARKIFTVGNELEVGGERGTLAAITPTQTLLEADGKTIAIANMTFLEEAARQENDPS